MSPLLVCLKNLTTSGTFYLPSYIRASVLPICKKITASCYSDLRLKGLNRTGQSVPNLYLDHRSEIVNQPLNQIAVQIGLQISAICATNRTKDPTPQLQATSAAPTQITLYKYHHCSRVIRFSLFLSLSLSHTHTDPHRKNKQKMAQENLESTNQTKALPAGLSIWPPTQRTREAVVRRLVETLTTPSSVLSKRFGVVPCPDAESAAQSIEQDALVAVSADGSTDSVEEGIKALQLYSKEVSERLLNFAKSRVAKGGDVPPSKGEESGETKDEEDAGSVVNSESTSA